MTSQRVRAHCPELLDGLNSFYERIWRSTRVDAGIKELIRLRCASVNACRY
jgi:alkylhydroperoxidase family enzyme